MVTRIVGTVVLLLLLAAADPVVAQIDNHSIPGEELAITRLDRAFDRADEHLTTAGTFTCQDHRARARYELLRATYNRLQAQAETLLGRHLNTDIRLNSCRARYNHRIFTYHVGRAGYFLRRAERMIRRFSAGRAVDEANYQSNRTDRHRYAVYGPIFGSSASL